MQLLPPIAYRDNPANAVTTKFVKTATNKMRCPVFTLAWTPEGRRLITGASSGEFTLWNGLTFNFETILQAHDSPVRAMVWSHNDQWMVTGDHGGYVKYWQSNMNNVKMFQVRNFEPGIYGKRFRAIFHMVCFLRSGAQGARAAHIVQPVGRQVRDLLGRRHRPRLRLLHMRGGARSPRPRLRRQVCPLASHQGTVL